MSMKRHFQNKFGSLKSLIGEPFTKEEHNLYIQGLLSHDKDFSKIAALIDSRSVNQVKAYHWSIWKKLKEKDPRFNGGETYRPGKRGPRWSEEEDNLLFEGFRLYGKKWAEVAAHVVTRDKEQCMERFRYLKNKAKTRT